MTAKLDLYVKHKSEYVSSTTGGVLGASGTNGADDSLGAGDMIGVRLAQPSARKVPNASRPRAACVMKGMAEGINGSV